MTTTKLVSQSSDWVNPQEKKNKEGDNDISDPPTFTEFLEYILHEDMTGACAHPHLIVMREVDWSRDQAGKKLSDQEMLNIKADFCGARLT